MRVYNLNLILVPVLHKLQTHRYNAVRFCVKIFSRVDFQVYLLDLLVHDSVKIVHSNIVLKSS